MNEDRLKALLRKTPIPGAEDAERRGLRVASAAFAERRPPRRQTAPRLAIALAAWTLLAALLLTPAGAVVRSWIDDAFTAGVRDAEPALTEIPGGGRLLVQSPQGPWVVQPDGSRRLIGHYAGATWSPRGLFVGAVSGRTLTAVEPDGTPRWSLSSKASPVTDPSWSPSGVRIAYRAGDALRVVVADGTRDRLLDPRSDPVPPVWLPGGPHLLAYVGRGGRLLVVDVDADAALSSTPAAPGVNGLSWAANGSELLQVTRSELWLTETRVEKLSGGLALGAARRVPLPGGTEVLTAAFAPQADLIAALLRRRLRDGSPRDEVVLIHPDGGPTRQLFAVSSGLEDLAWSPDGSRLLVTWPAADQWLFLPLDGRRIRAIGDVSAAFSPAADRLARFPRIDGWCCSAATAGGG